MRGWPKARRMTSVGTSGDDGAEGVGMPNTTFHFVYFLCTMEEPDRPEKGDVAVCSLI